MDGVLIVDKREGVTSHDVVDEVRKLVGQRRVGHFGTLDPLATGVLPVAIGHATRLQQFYLGSRKTYSGSIRFGFSTTTYDSTGEATSEVKGVVISPSDLKTARDRFVGELQQVPPAFSAKKINGVSAHRLARKDRPVKLAPVRVHVYRFEIKLRSADAADFEIECSGGTYIRSIAHDLGMTLGCGAHLVSLRRSASAEFTLHQAIPPDILFHARRSEPVDSWKNYLIALEDLIPWFPSINLTEIESFRAKSGMTIEVDSQRVLSRDGHQYSEIIGEWVRLFDENRKLLGLGRMEPQSGGSELVSIKPKIILAAH